MPTVDVPEPIYQDVVVLCSIVRSEKDKRLVAKVKGMLGELALEFAHDKLGVAFLRLPDREGFADLHSKLGTFEVKNHSKVSPHWRWLQYVRQAKLGAGGEQPYLVATSEMGVPPAELHGVTLLRYPFVSSVKGFRRAVKQLVAQLGALLLPRSCAMFRPCSVGLGVGHTLAERLRSLDWCLPSGHPFPSGAVSALRSPAFTLCLWGARPVHVGSRRQVEQFEVGKTYQPFHRQRKPAAPYLPKGNEQPCETHDNLPEATAKQGTSKLDNTATKPATSIRNVASCHSLAICKSNFTFVLSLLLSQLKGLQGLKGCWRGVATALCSAMRAASQADRLASRLSSVAAGERHTIRCVIGHTYSDNEPRCDRAALQVGSTGGGLHG